MLILPPSARYDRLASLLKSRMQERLTPQELQAQPSQLPAQLAQAEQELVFVSCQHVGCSMEKGTVPRCHFEENLVLKERVDVNWCGEIC
jgi:hypothetical protein